MLRHHSKLNNIYTSLTLYHCVHLCVKTVSFKWVFLGTLGLLFPKKVWKWKSFIYIMDILIMKPPKFQHCWSWNFEDLEEMYGYEIRWQKFEIFTMFSSRYLAEHEYLWIFSVVWITVHVVIRNYGLRIFNDLKPCSVIKFARAGAVS